jgi:hypothetical protein
LILFEGLLMVHSHLLMPFGCGAGPVELLAKAGIKVISTKAENSLVIALNPGKLGAID